MHNFEFVDDSLAAEHSIEFECCAICYATKDLRPRSTKTDFAVLCSKHFGAVALDQEVGPQGVFATDVERKQYRFRLYQLGFDMGDEFKDAPRRQDERTRKLVDGTWRVLL